MTAPSLSKALPNLTSLEREGLLKLQALHHSQTEQLALQDQKIAELEAKIQTGEAAVTRLTALLTSLLGPVDLDTS